MCPNSWGCSLPSLSAIGKAVRTREIADKTTQETAYYLLSTALSAERFNQVVRSHWGIENSLHWPLDVVMNEDQDRNRLGNGPENLTILRHMAINAMQKDTTKGSLRGKFKRAGWCLPLPHPDPILKCDYPGIAIFREPPLAARMGHSGRLIRRSPASTTTASPASAT